MELSLLRKGKSNYMENPNAYFIWRERQFDLLCDDIRIFKTN